MKYLFRNLKSITSQFIRFFNPKKLINNTLPILKYHFPSLPFISQFVGNHASYISFHDQSFPFISRFVGNQENFVGNDDSDNEEKCSFLSHERFSKLSINECALLCLIYDQCKTKDDHNSDFISVLQVAELFNISNQAARRLLIKFDQKTKLKCNKIRQKKFIYRQYELNVSDMQILDNLVVNKKHSHFPVSSNFDAISSSSINIININNKYKTTTYVDSLEPRSSESESTHSCSVIKNTEIEKTLTWDEVKFSDLDRIGFRKLHLKQLEKFNTPDIVQESINHFSWALDNNEKIKNHQSPMNMLMGVLRRGSVWIESGYETPECVALKKLIHERESHRKMISEQIDELAKTEFNDWVISKTQDELLKLVPEFFRTGEKRASGRDACLRKYFREYVLIPSLKNRGIIGRNFWDEIG